VDDPIDRAKAAAARAAVARLSEGESVALGTGSTTAFAIREIARRFPKGDSLQLVSSSTGSEALAAELGLPIRGLAAGDRFRWMIDGADEVSERLDLTKGGGGALLREKLLARLSERLLVIVDASKQVRTLGSRVPIPIEVVPYARPYIIGEVERMGDRARVRLARPGGPPLQTDNRLEIVDVTPAKPIDDPAEFDRRLHAIPGVVETGLFLGMADRVYVGRPDGSVQEIPRR
jgi:ribose 5-phosphate isomerase A